MIRVLVLLVTVSGFCNKGQYNFTNTSECQDCPMGYHNDRINNALKECFRCNTGTFQDQPRSTLCKNCPNGFYQNSPAGVNCTECDHYITHESECVETCPKHSWENNTTKKCDFCLGIGQYSVGNSQICQQCQSGHYKEQAGPNECEECPAGYIGNVTNCFECAAGQGILNGMCNDCVAGKYGFRGDCYECGSGKYTSSTKQTECISCSNGKFQDSKQATDCKNCQSGQYSKTSAVSCLYCPSGYGIEDEGQTTCEPCNGAQTVKGVCVKCEQGLFLNDKQCITCPRGWISNDFGTGCSMCLSGKYSNDNTCKSCASGAYGNIPDGGSWKCCLQGDVGCEDCPAGEHRVDTGCVKCPMGWVSEADGLCEQCDYAEGEYSSIAGNTRCKKCPEGKSTDGQTCTDCEAGQYELQFKCTDCPRGWYSDKDNSPNPTCARCDEQLTTVGTGSKNVNSCNSKCTGATFVDQYGDCQECDLGKYVNGRNCQVCPLGKHKDIRSNYECRDCPAGFTTMETGNIDCFVCPEGEKCGCPWGKFGTKDSCEDCPAGYFSTGNTECTTCPLTTYQDEKGQGACQDCPAGLYGDQLSLETCKDCSAGQFQMTTGNEACDDCPKGRWSTDGLVMCTNCTAGKTTQETGSTEIGNCTDCQPGKMEKDNLCINCFEGTYQNKTGDTVCNACPGTTWSAPGARAASECFGTKGLRTYTIGNVQDSKQTTPHKTSCELRPNFVMVCSACTCDADARNGFWAGPLCNECRRGFATRFCTSICPGYDGRHDSTICNGNGRCWFGRQGNGLCYCGGKHILDESSENVFVDVQYCPVGKICPGYGVEKIQQTTYIPLYYLINYRQYSTFVLQMSKYTPQRGHMWFKRFSPSKAFENTCTVCNTKYVDSALTEIGYWDRENMYEKFPLLAQSKNGFHGENCQYECAVCLNGGECVHSPHPYRYTYTIHSTFKEQRSAKYPTTTCLCSATVFDASHMCCPNGFQPYVYYGKRGTTPYSRFSTLPYITSVDNNIDLGYYRDIDLSLEIDHRTVYIEPEDRKIAIAVGTAIVNVDFSTVGPYDNHVYHGTTKEICRACPGLFGKGIRVVDNLIQTEQEAENYWWNFPASAGSKKCQGQGVCDFYEKPKEVDVDFMGHVTEYTMLHRGRMCKSTSVGGFVNINPSTENEITSLEQCVKYAQDNFASFIAWAPEFYMGGELGDIDSEDLETEVRAKDNAAITASEAWVKNTDPALSQTQYSVLKGDLPRPNSDSTYEVHPRIVKRCIAFTSCFELRSIESSSYRAFNVYTVEKGRGDERLKEATSDRFDTCFTYTKNYDHDPDRVGRRQKFGLYLTQNYKQGDDPFLGGLCPKGYFCSQNSEGTGFKEACPIGYYQPLEGQTRTDKDIHCSIRSTNFDNGRIYVPPNGKYIANADTITSPEKCTKILEYLGYDISNTTSTHAPYGCYLQSTAQYGTYVGSFNSNMERHVVDGVGITNECFATNSDASIQYWYKCVLDTSPCQQNLAMKLASVFVDTVCQRCPRDSYSPEGSYECTACSSGRVKKVTGTFSPMNIEIYNTPNIQNNIQPWFYLANEGGTESDDCALVPPSILHVPTANSKMFESSDSNQYLPVVSCPFGYSSQPGTYVINDIWNMQSIIQNDKDIMIEPYIKISAEKTFVESDEPCSCMPASYEMEYVIPDSVEKCRSFNSVSESGDPQTVKGLWHGCMRFDNSRVGEYLNNPTRINNYPTTGVKYLCERVIRDRTLMQELVSTYCYPCPGDAMTGPGASMCSTCSANLIKKNIKISLQKLVMNAQTRMYDCGNTANQLPLTVNQIPSCPSIERQQYDMSMDISYEKDILSWYFLKQNDRMWEADWVFGVIKDPLLPSDSMELTITDCILACSTVFDKNYLFNKDYNVSLGGVKPVRVGYAQDIKKRNWCVCNEGNTTKPRDATGIAVDDNYNTSGTECYKLIGQHPTRIKNATCIKESNVKVIWYESVIVDNWANNEFPLCGLCKPGKSYTGSDCEDCTEGKYTADMSQSMRASCQLCPAGFFQDSTSRTGCIECYPGFFQPEGAGKKCENCPAGFHQDGFQGVSCKHCIQGRVQRIAAQPYCVECEPGHYESSPENDTVVNDNACKSCEPGYATHQYGRAQCTACNPGQYQDAARQFTCKNCDRGRYGSELALDYTCTACPAGYVQPESGNKTCNPCFGGTYTVATIPQKCTSGSPCLWSGDTAKVSINAKYQANTGEFTCTPCPHSHMCTFDESPRSCGAGHVMTAGVYSQACYKCDGQTWADPTKEGTCEICDKKSVVNAAATACTSCKEIEGNVVMPPGCGGMTRCTSCKQCGKTQKAVNGVCTDCPPATPIRGSDNKCVECPKEDNKKTYWTGTSAGLCVKCPAVGWNKLKSPSKSSSITGCNGCEGFKLHWYKDKKNGNQGTMKKSQDLDTNGYLKYIGPWQSCCWAFNDYVKISTWIITKPGKPGYLQIYNSVKNEIDNPYEDWIIYTLKDENSNVIVGPTKLKETEGSKKELCLEGGKIFYLEFEYQNADGGGNFKVYTYNANTFKEKPDSIRISTCSTVRDINNPTTTKCNDKTYNTAVKDF